MLVVATLWWIVFFAAVGLAVGSYLNVVIYRIPRNISTSAPLWSFCPLCRARIHWYDNLPVLSFVRLGGRCRACGTPISPRYPAVELLMATLTLVVLDAFCVAGLRNGTHDLGLGITERLYHDWPIILAHVVLFGCLLAMSAIDLEHYFIDIRFTDFAVLAGFALHLIWTPAARAWTPSIGGAWHRPGPTTAAVSIAVTLTVVVTWLVIRLFAPRPEEESEANTATVAAADSSPAIASQEWGTCTADIRTGSGPARVAAWLAALVFVVVAVSMTIDALSAEPRLLPSWRLLVPIVMCFALIVGMGVPRRSADTEIVQAIESERSSARSMALRELLLLVPAIVGGAVVAWLCLENDAFGSWCEGVFAWCPRGSWRPITGLATAASGFVVGGALGWAVRIVFTLILGREAFGTGDIHLMAAAGCVAGWPVVVLGFVLTSFLALAGWLVTLPFKRTRAIPLVPWLSLAFLIVVVFHDPLSKLGPVRNAVYLFDAVTSGKLTGPVN